MGLSARTVRLQRLPSPDRAGPWSSSPCGFRLGVVMPATNSSSSCLLQSGSSSKARWVLCVLAFVATGAAAYLAGARKSELTRQHAATATIRHRYGHSEGVVQNGSEGLDRPDAAQVERQLLSDENLRRVLRRAGGSRLMTDDRSAGPDWSLDEVRRDLRVTATGMSSPEGLHVSISYTDQNPDRAIRLVNALAEGYADEHGAKLEATLRRDYLEAQAAAESARQELFEAQGQLDDVIRGRFLRQQSLAQRPAKRGPEPASVAEPPSHAPSEAPAPQIAEDPEKIELESQLAELEERRAELLVDRTPAHPVVRDVETRIARLKEQLASISSQGPPERSEVRSPTEGPVLESPAVERLSVTPEPVAPEPVAPEEASPPETVEEYAESAQAFGAHKEALDQARQNYRRFSEIKRRAREEQLQSGNIELELADKCEVCQSVEGSPRFLLVAVAAALAVAFGVALISSGFDTDPPLTTPGQVEKALPVPIVGAIPATGPSWARTSGERFRPASGWGKIIGGVLLIAVCFGILVVLY